MYRSRRSSENPSGSRCCVCMYVCMYVRLSICIVREGLRRTLPVRDAVYVYICMYVCMYVRVLGYTCMYICIYIRIRILWGTCFGCDAVYVCMCVSIHAYLHGHMHLYACIYIHTCIYTYMHTTSLQNVTGMGHWIEP